MIAVVACSVWISARAATGPDGQLNRAAFPPGIGESVRAIEPCPLVAAIFETPPDAPTTMLNAHVVDTTPGFYQGKPATLLTVEDERKCAAMAAALRAVHRDFGAERFDRFLYVVVARNRSVSQSNVPDVLEQRDQRCR